MNKKPRRKASPKKNKYGNFVHNVITLRMAKRFRTAMEFASFLGVNPKRYSEVETGRLCPDIDLILAVNNKLGYSFEQMKYSYMRVELLISEHKEEEDL